MLRRPRASESKTPSIARDQPAQPSAAATAKRAWGPIGVRLDTTSAAAIDHLARAGGDEYGYESNSTKAEGRRAACAAAAVAAAKATRPGFGSYLNNVRARGERRGRQAACDTRQRRRALYDGEAQGGLVWNPFCFVVADSAAL